MFTSQLRRWWWNVWECWKATVEKGKKITFFFRIIKASALHLKRKGKIEGHILSIQRLAKVSAVFIFSSRTWCPWNKVNFGLWEHFTTLSSKFINHSFKITWMFYQQMTWNVSLSERVQIVRYWCVLQLTNATDSVKYRSTEQEWTFLCYSPNVKMHFQNDIWTGQLFGDTRRCAVRVNQYQKC